MSLSVPEFPARGAVVGGAPVARPEAPSRRVAVSTAARAVAFGSAAMLGAVWGAPIMVRMIGDVDFPFHLETAEHFAATGTVTVPHFLLQVVLGVVLATRMFSSTAQARVAFFCALYAAAAAAIAWYVARDSRSNGALAGSVLLAVVVLMAGPILPRGDFSLFLIGYFPPNVYHNPTMLMAKPLLVFAFASTVAALARTGRAGAGELVLLAAPVVLLGLAKPNYLGCIVPVVMAWAAWATVRRQPVSWTRVVTVCAAAVATLASGYVLYKSDELGFDTSVIYAPLRVIALYAPVDGASIARSLAASLAFPLAVVAMWPRAAAGDVSMRAAWGGTIVALLFSYVLAEGGDRTDHGNFLWTGQMGVFVLFVASAAFVRQRLQLSSPSVLMFGRALVVGVLLLFHVESGLRHVALKIDVAQWLAFWK